MKPLIDLFDSDLRKLFCNNSFFLLIDTLNGWIRVDTIVHEYFILGRRGKRFCIDVFPDLKGIGNLRVTRYPILRGYVLQIRLMTVFNI